ncbi:MAG: translation initiation factor [Chitinophagales bacterium]|jgi:translation initiation factor 1|nr:translation initiation factor [Chitinophagales bacterium]HQO89022.1 translation initiation factor [Chitinophagales bacterium]
MSKNWKDRLGTVYSTNPDFQYQSEQEEEQETLEKSKQLLVVCTDSKQRKGKTVTLVQQFIGKNEDLETLAKFLKTKCGVGGAAKDGEIVLQGDFKQKVKEILEKEGYKVKVR